MTSGAGCAVAAPAAFSGVFSGFWSSDSWDMAVLELKVSLKGQPFATWADPVDFKAIGENLQVFVFIDNLWLTLLLSTTCAMSVPVT